MRMGRSYLHSASSRGTSTAIYAEDGRPQLQCDEGRQLRTWNMQEMSCLEDAWQPEGERRRRRRQRRRRACGSTRRLEGEVTSACSNGGPRINSNSSGGSDLLSSILGGNFGVINKPTTPPNPPPRRWWWTRRRRRQGDCQRCECGRRVRRRLSSGCMRRRRWMLQSLSREAPGCACCPSSARQLATAR